MPTWDDVVSIGLRFPRVDRAELAELIEDAWRIRAPKRLVKAFDAEP